MPWILSFSSRSGSGSGSRSGSRIFKLFGKRSNGNTYELRSADVATDKPVNDVGRNGNKIAVTQTYSVRGSKSKSDGDSTDDLFEPQGREWNGAR